MRTTLTLDDDLARALKERARTTGRPFKEVVNAVLRRGLTSGERPTASLEPFVVEPKHCGFRVGIDLRRLNQLVDQLEIEDFVLGLAKRTTGGEPEGSCPAADRVHDPGGPDEPDGPDQSDGPDEPLS